MNIKMISTGKFSLNGMQVTTYPQGTTLADETPEKVKAYFVNQGIAEELKIEKKAIEPKEAPVMKPEVSKVVEPEVKKQKKQGKKKVK